MDGLNELIQWCITNKAWLTVNYSPFDNAYKVFVNPGRTMTSARWYKDLDEAVKACWVAIGGKPDPMPKELISIKEMRDTILEVSSATKEAMKEIGYNPAGELISIKRRGRPKGSRNKPKAVASE